MDRNLALELVRVTEAAALACGRWVGKGDKNNADGAATEAMRRTLDSIEINGTVVIGEGEMDEAPMLYIGEKVGNEGAPEVDIAVDPLEGTIICAKGMTGAITTIALAAVMNRFQNRSQERKSMNPKIVGQKMATLAFVSMLVVVAPVRADFETVRVAYNLSYPVFVTHRATTIICTSSRSEVGSGCWT